MLLEAGITPKNNTVPIGQAFIKQTNGAGGNSTSYTVPPLVSAVAKIPTAQLPVPQPVPVAVPVPVPVPVPVAVPGQAIEPTTAKKFPTLKGFFN